MSLLYQFWKLPNTGAPTFLLIKIIFLVCPIWGFLGSAGVGVYAQARLLPPGHEAGEPAVHGSRPSQDRGLWFGSGDQVPAALHGLRVHALVPGTGGPPQKVQRKVLLSLALTIEIYNKSHYFQLYELYTIHII